MPEGRASVDKIALHHYVLKCGTRHLHDVLLAASPPPGIAMFVSTPCSVVSTFGTVNC